MQVLITGSTGRLGRLLRAAWAQNKVSGFEPLWSCRQAVHPADVVWDILSGPAPALAKGCVVLHLAGVLHGNQAALSANAAMALTVCAAANAAGARHVFLASSAAVYGMGQADHDETDAPAPQSDYGRAKLAMERKARHWAHLSGPDSPGITCLRIGNVLGCDALFGEGAAGRAIVLDPVVGQACGPVRSYIGPAALAQVVSGLIGQLAQGITLPEILNIAAAGPLGMADLLCAAQTPYQFGKPNPQTIPRVGLSTRQLDRLVPLQRADAAAMVAEWRRVLAGVT